MSYDLPIAERPVLDLRLWLRGFRDRSPSHCHGEPVGGYWLRVGQRDGWHPTRAQISHIKIPDCPGLRVPGTIVVFADFRRQAAGTWRVLSKQDGTGASWQLVLSSVADVVSWATPGASAATVPYVGARMLVLRHEQGTQPRFSVDAGPEVLGASVSTVPDSSASVHFGGLYNTGSLNNLMPHHGALVFTEVISADAEQALLGWYDNQITPELRTPGLGYQYPGGTQPGDLVWRAALDTARATIGDTASGELGMSGLHVASGTWAVDEDAAGRFAECVGSGRLTARLLGADGYTTRAFGFDGTATLTKTAAGLEIDASAGAKIRRVEIAA